MKILMLTPYLPYPPSSGGQIRSYNLIKELSKHHEIYLIGLIKQETEKKHIEHLKKYCKEIYACSRSKTPWTLKNILKSVFGVLPFVVIRNYSQEARIIVEKLLKNEKIDLIHAETFYVMPHIPETKVPILLVEQTIEYKVYQHYLDNLKVPLLPLFLQIDIMKLKYWEKTYWEKATIVGAVSEEDRDQMHKLIPQLPVEIIPNAAGEDLMELYSKKLHNNPTTFLYVANFSWLQNVEGAQILAQKVFPEILSEIPQANCIIAGQYAADKISNLVGDRIEILDLPRDSISAVKDAYSRGSIFIAPLEGPGGTRLKILGAMATGLPVISSKTGVAGLDVTDGVNVLIAKTPHEFAVKAKQILRDHQLFSLIRANARKLVEDQYAYPKIALKLEKVYRQIKQS
ncbi:hypothetical protein A3D80_00300 [Candidatus Roizmanbacteria bacterium RIFCSPHIGHO2_02_FULL_40_13b]|uniref:Glycosyltransferase subfamily 4-like N-terminal domain-containing protein n=1 Tax=Candidatus Roizmanbacteria bacterium RIFCSPHIGHO2_01_FULL_39_24 TaxID=1802032 RepID=A0A1F7GK48_9BACT|nr:MAG: hypothetical protein A2799_00420 [Candidatus Roizmanbacteria bacterium RIFCSPHIGHO2_01_FULL_39_24]OGK28076.1 MAG: hypothetical protein A3D80_00300 [Candidatus Roizmanbacteria bacterium RIFCSPHIGHO2_02_FULL_40_13b]OGK49585.1 MAG: hypothetical protein A3A56_04270 [Candidatus Roizmanbacteria bacterium RIFCSPLOWO2_01_FULL_40_32]OGK57020.1 MAG: hypothetical protein A3H83_00850 [Candidatus Roizmanbacteria bacterium RIFCSPLOWO2_02_FULL_39_8]